MNVARASALTWFRPESAELFWEIRVKGLKVSDSLNHSVPWMSCLASLKWRKWPSGNKLTSLCIGLGSAGSRSGSCLRKSTCCSLAHTMTSLASTSMRSIRELCNFSKSSVRLYRKISSNLRSLDLEFSHLATDAKSNLLKIRLPAKRSCLKTMVKLYLKSTMLGYWSITGVTMRLPPKVKSIFG